MRVIDVSEVHAVAQRVLRRHVVLSDERRHVMHLEEHTALLLTWLDCARRQAIRPTPAHRDVTVGNEREFRLPGEEILAEYPMRAPHPPVGIDAPRIAVFDDAARLDGRQIERLGEEL